ncbi:MAG: EamA family transporter [Gemmatimonadetes bacterium]|nr:EamA family transporter [Gemmatimonadota bacterium]MYA64272.1 EamA family transporter [Gemmatimonadota bacterium]MYB99963.1 EamA family transporter [Gemmatimonadota bacterium]MYH52612.1 EamA family transporter [Gemmatimonadota bacterium]MYK66402.1 EamA family transporter [Gemmatimonadota bacterium]
MTSSARGKHDLTVDLGLVLTAVIWGMNFPVVKAVLREMEPLAFNALRFPCAAFAVWFLLKAQGRRLMPYRKDWWTVIALGAAGHVIFQICFIFGLDLTLTGNAAILLSTTPVWVLLISAALGRERFNASILAGVLGTLAGMVILVTGGSHEMGSARGGDFLVLGAAVSWSVYTVFSRRMTKRRGVLEMTAWTLWAGLPFIMLMGIPDLIRTDWGAVSAGAWLGIVYAGVFAIAVAYLLWYRGVRAIGQSRTSVYQNLVPVIALIAAWFWLSEMPTPQQLAGAGVILAGVVVARRSPRR